MIFLIASLVGVIIVLFMSLRCMRNKNIGMAKAYGESLEANKRLAQSLEKKQSELAAAERTVRKLERTG